MKVLQSGKHRITFYFGNQTLNGRGYNHTGMDFVKAPSLLDNIVAAARGKVIAVVKNVTGYKVGSYGNYVMLEHGNGIRTLYAHMKYGSVGINVGDIVEKGQVIGYMGATGYVTGAHLHFEVRKNNVCVDPLPYYQDKIGISPYENGTSEFWVRVDKAVGANVRKEPNTNSDFSGSKFLKKGDRFLAIEMVEGETVSGNNKWYHSKVGNYV